MTTNEGRGSGETRGACPATIYLPISDEFAIYCGGDAGHSGPHSCTTESDADAGEKAVEVTISWPNKISGPSHLDAAGTVL